MELAMDYTEIFEYLDQMRISARINMMGAVPYIQEQFNLTEGQAETALRRWQDSFSETRTAAARAKQYEELD